MLTEVEHISILTEHELCYMNIEQSAERSLPAKCFTAHYSFKHEFIKAEVMNKTTRTEIRKNKTPNYFSEFFRTRFLPFRILELKCH